MFGDDREPDFGDFVLGRQTAAVDPIVPAAAVGPLVPAAAVGAIVLAAAVGPIVPAAAVNAIVPAAAAAADAIVPAPRRKHRKTHGAFAGSLAARSLEIKRAFSSSGNTVRWAARRERQLEAVFLIVFLSTYLIG